MLAGSTDKHINDKAYLGTIPVSKYAIKTYPITLTINNFFSNGVKDFS